MSEETTQTKELEVPPLKIITSVLGDTEKAQKIKVDPELVEINQVISNAISLLMDIANLLRDVPKIAAVNLALNKDLKAVKIRLILLFILK
jgi:hypothetical protein